ncbi:MAG: serine protein kinase RIO [Candidatus Micrarchaeia archaeon]
MARRVGKRKMPDIALYKLKEYEKTEGGVFDKQAMLYLSKLFNAGIISKLEHPVARGKEADIYIADAGKSDKVRGNYVAVKFFRVETSSFSSMTDYIVGDERFSRIRSSKRFIVSTWCKKEYGNLRIAQSAGVPVPSPYMFSGSVLAMEFIGDNGGTPAPMLKDVELDDPSAALDEIIADIGKLYNYRLIHADMSEYNILVKEGRLYVIDFGQAVTIKHPNAMPFLMRDISNICSYFYKRYGIERDPKQIFEKIAGKAEADAVF